MIKIRIKPLWYPKQRRLLFFEPLLFFGTRQLPISLKWMVSISDFSSRRLAIIAWKNSSRVSIRFAIYFNTKKNTLDLGTNKDLTVSVQNRRALQYKTHYFNSKKRVTIFAHQYQWSISYYKSTIQNSNTYVPSTKHLDRTDVILIINDGST